MDYLEALYSIQSTTGAAQAATGTGTDTREPDTSFDDMLTSLLGTSGVAGSNSSLLTGLLDGSLSVTDSSQLVSALLGSGDNGDNASLLTGMDTSNLSADSLSALMNLTQTNEQDWLTRMLENLSSSTGENEEEDDLSAYYTAMAALASAQKDILLT